MAMLPRLRPREVLRPRRSRWRSSAPARSRAAWCTPTCAAAAASERPDPPHPCLAPILDRTLGVPLFQEQVMQIAIVGADYTPRRGRSAPARHGGLAQDGQLERHRRAAARAASRENGIAREFGEQLFEQIHGFGEYGFPESPRRELRAPRVRVGVAQGAPPGGVHLRAAQRAADGVLLARRTHRRGRAAARGRGAAALRGAEHLGLHAGARGG